VGAVVVGLEVGATMTGLEVGTTAFLLGKGSTGEGAEATRLLAGRIGDIGIC